MSLDLTIMCEVREVNNIKQININGVRIIDVKGREDCANFSGTNIPREDIFRE